MALRKKYFMHVLGYVILYHFLSTEGPILNLIKSEGFFLVTDMVKGHNPKKTQIRGLNQISPININQTNATLASKGPNQEIQVPTKN